MQSKAPNFASKLAGSKLKYKIAGFVIVSVLTGIPAALFGQQDNHAAVIPSANRKPAPDFDLVSETGAKVRLSDYRGKVVLLDFWATGCGGCVYEIPSFIKLEKAYKGTDFTALGVSMDVWYEKLKDADEAWGRVKPFMAKYGVNYPIAMGDDAVIKAYALHIFPTTYLIDKSGRIAVAYVGVLVDKDNVARNIKSLLQEPPVGAVMQ